MCVKPKIRLPALVAGAALLAGSGCVHEDAVAAGKPVFDPGKYPREHFQWCMKTHFTSYRALDNTYRTAEGRRVQCISPFLKK